jgi:hypothetical protein
MLASGVNSVNKQSAGFGAITRRIVITGSKFADVTKYANDLVTGPKHGSLLAFYLNKGKNTLAVMKYTDVADTFGMNFSKILNHKNTKLINTDQIKAKK